VFYFVHRSEPSQGGCVSHMFADCIVRKYRMSFKNNGLYFVYELL